MSQAFTNSSRNPAARRRAAQACGTCRSRKVRCDAGTPKCGLCKSLNVDCVYLDPEAQRLDPSTRLLLDRIQKLEDRIFSSPPESTTILSSTQPGTPPTVRSSDRPQQSTIRTPGVEDVRESEVGSASREEFLLPTLHNANTTNLYQWTVVQALLSEDRMSYGDMGFHGSILPEATDIFLLSDSGGLPAAENQSRNLFRNPVCSDTSEVTLQNDMEDSFLSQFKDFKELVHEFFLNVHVFYPILSQPEIYDMLQIVAESERNKTSKSRELGTTKYCLLLMVLCLGSVARDRTNLIFSDGSRHSPVPPVDARSLSYSSESVLWAKAKLLLGTVCFNDSIEAAQCFALSSIYLGSRGRTLESHQQIHLAARKVGILAKRTILQSPETPEFLDSFCRLFWVIYVYESDFAMELSLTPPSGITRFEEMVKYPTSEQTNFEYHSPMNLDTSSPSGYADHTARLSYSSDSNLVAFQISTNSAIRRFLNRITAVIYDPRESWRKKDHTTYVSWLLKISNELQNHHEAIHNNLPPFLLSTNPRAFLQDNSRKGTSAADHRELSNHFWNVSRLRGRYSAGQYLICRASYEFALLNPKAVSSHPRRQEIMDKCRSCIQSCVEFVGIFSMEPVNSMTNLFATGMATFAMVIILMIATISPQFQQIIPADIDEVIISGQQNLKRFSLSVTEFEWHLQKLEELDRARKVRQAENASEMLISD
ncbi:hypothetical protein BKA64DRAFT_373122 [Cadophora sp. MPI-SDFR-AT-0126]|nr:hypothetical protein BKA64DRAFT_373122 [Leotiomycetes sp. MPI-SDFR-AT-0126]